MTSCTVRAWASAAEVACTRLVHAAPLLVEFLTRDGVRQLLGGVPDDPEDAAGAAVGVAPDEPLGVGPAQRAVAEPAAEVGAVTLLPRFQRLHEHGVEPGALVLGDPLAEIGRPVVVLLGPQIEHVQRRPVQVHEATVQIPVEAAHTVQGEAEVRVGGPVFRE